MKKRLLSILTCLALCLSLLPATALATDDPAPSASPAAGTPTVIAGHGGTVAQDTYTYIVGQQPTVTRPVGDTQVADIGAKVEATFRLQSSPGPAPNIYVGGVGLYGGASTIAYAKTDTNGAVTTEGASADDYNIKWDGETLTLKDATIHCVETDGIHSGIQRAGDLHLVLEEENRISGSSSVTFKDLFGVHASGDLTVSGEGEIFIALDRTQYGPTRGLYGGGNITIESGTLNAAIEGPGAGRGAYAENGVYINGGTITMNSADLYGRERGVTVTPPEGYYITVEYGESSEKTNTYTYTETETVDYVITSSEYFHSEVIDNTTEVRNPNITIGGVAMYGASDSVAYATTDESGTVIEITGEDFDPNTDSWNIQWDGATLTLNAATLNGGISCGGFTLALIGNNAVTVSALGAFGIDASGDLIIAGKGTLRVSSSYRGISASSLTIRGGDITVEAQDRAFVVSNAFILEPPEGGAIFVEAGKNESSAAAIGTYKASEDIRDAVDSSPYFRICPAVPVTGVELSEDRLDLIEGEAETLTAAVAPDTATDTRVTWASSDPDVAAVGQDGAVTANAPGEATITVTTADGAFTDHCTVTVSAKSYQISAAPSALNFSSAEEGYLEAPAAQTVTVTNVGNQSVTVTLPTSTNYTITASTGFTNGTATLAPNGTAQFSVRPNTGLGVGVHDAVLTISGSNGASTEVALYFTVTETAHTHSYNTAVWVSDGTSHWHACSCGAKENVTAHSGGTATCLEQAECTICGTAYGALGAHSYDEQPWLSDGDGHWRVCSVCGDPSAAEAHTFANGKCTVCGRREEYTITFNAAGGTTPAPQTTVDGKLASLPASTRSGYDFQGWYTEESGGTLVTTDTVFTNDTTVYARWTVRTGGGGGGGGGSGQPAQPTGPSTDNNDGWTDIQEEIGGAEDGDTVSIDMNGETEIPREVLEEVAGKDVTVELDMGGGVSWIINGQDVPESASLSDLNLGVSMDTNGISADVINTVTAEYGAVQVSLDHDGEFGFVLTLTAPLGRENAGHWANLYHYNEGAETLTFVSSTRIAGDGSAALRMTHASQYAIVIDEKSHALPFADAPTGYWAYDAILYVYDNGLMAGTSDTTFAPDDTTSRSMIVTILYRLEGEPVVDDAMDFADVAGDAWYTDAVLWAAGEGIVGGYGDGLFGSDDPVTREQLAAILYRYAVYKGYDVSIGEDTNLLSYTDFADLSEYAIPAMQWACGAGIVNGTSESTLTPQGEATRAQVAVMLERFCEQYQ